MNFFEHQDRAKQTTLYLLGLFAIALMGMTLLLYGLALIVFHDAEQPFRIWNPGLLMLATLIVVGVVGGSSAVKWQALQGGGKVVAEDLGGQLVHPDTADAAQQRLLNVVEEMAIASGISVPAVYLLAQERSINAFAAGLTPENAVIGVTQGSLEQLSRDELQGVIGHEFSHILNGDMRMNLRLIGVLHGILLIYLAGRMMYSRGMIGIAALLHGAHRQSSRSSPSSSQSRRVSRSHWLGLGLMAVGGLGLICGRLIKSAISRQREFLADASSVQFTRNPSGLSGALRKIGGYKAGSSIQVVGVEEASHLFFGEALKLAFWQGIFATHPPLQQRIQRIEGNAWQASTAPPSLSPPVSTQPAPVTMAPPQPVSSRPSPPPAASAKPS
ncbi:MAG: peptidase M48, partial [Leptolyngbya sp. DLM2.Bin15]